MAGYFVNGSGIKGSIRKMLVDLYPMVGTIITPEGKNDGGCDIFTIYGQGSGYYYATMYADSHPDNPYYHSEDALARCIRSWEYYYHELTLEDGQTKIITMNQFWQTLFEEWNTLRLLSTLELVGDRLDPGMRARWQERAYRSAEGIVLDIREKYLDEEFLKTLPYQTPNHFMWRLCVGYRFGLMTGREDILKDCDKMMEVICGVQPESGGWLEGGSMVNQYAHTSYGAIGLYAAYQKNANPIIREAALKCAHYLLRGYYDNGTPIDALDTRNRYTPSFQNPYIACSLMDDPAVCFFTSCQIKRLYETKEQLSRDHHSLCFLLSAYEAMPEEPRFCMDNPAKGEDVYRFPGQPCSILRKDGWTIAMNCDTQHAHSRRFILERQNLFSVYEAKHMVIVGGGHSTSTPELSCINLIRDGTLAYLHSEGKLLENGEGMELVYGGVRFAIRFAVMGNQVKIRYEILDELMETDKVLIHLPLYIQNKEKLAVNGKSCGLKGMERFWDAGEKVLLDDVSFHFSKEVEVLYPVFAYDCYYQVQTPRHSNAFAVLTAVLDYNTASFEAVLTI